MPPTNMKKPSVILSIISGLVLIAASILSFLVNKMLWISSVEFPLAWFGFYDIATAIIVLLEVPRQARGENFSRYYFTIVLITCVMMVVSIAMLVQDMDYVLVPHLAGCAAGLAGAFFNIHERRRGSG